MSDHQSDQFLSLGDGVDCDDAINIGMTIVEMADRVKVGHSVLPGAQATWAFDMEDTRYRVVVTVVGPSRRGGI